MVSMLWIAAVPRKQPALTLRPLWKQTSVERLRSRTLTRICTLQRWGDHASLELQAPKGRRSSLLDLGLVAPTWRHRAQGAVPTIPRVVLGECRLRLELRACGRAS